MSLFFTKSLRVFEEWTVAEKRQVDEDDIGGEGEQPRGGILLRISKYLKATPV